MLLTTHYWWPHLGGIERVALRQAQHLVARGHQVRILTSAVGHTDEVETTSARPDGFGVTRIPAWNGLERIGVPWPVFAPGVAPHARSLMRWSDVVVCHGQVFGATLAATWHSRRTGKPVVLVQHNPDIAYDAALLALLQRMTAASLARWTLDRAAKILVPSAATESYVRTLTKNSVEVLPWGLDLDRFQPHGSEELRDEERGSLGIPKGATLVVAAGRLSEKNRFSILIQACRAAADRITGLRCVILGTGPHMDRLRRLADELGLSSQVELPGYVDDACLQAYLRSADLVVATAGSNEGFGLLVAEALASGVPVVAGSAGGQVDLVHENVNGWFFDGTAEGLARVMVTARGHLDVRGWAAWAAAARRSVEQFTWERHCVALERVFHECGAAAGEPA